MQRVLSVPTKRAADLRWAGRLTIQWTTRADLHAAMKLLTDAVASALRRLLIDVCQAGATVKPLMETTRFFSFSSVLGPPG